MESEGERREVERLSRRAGLQRQFSNRAVSSAGSLRSAHTPQDDEHHEEEVIEMEPRSWSRRNGWSCPPHPLQLAAWVVILYITFLQFIVVVPGYRSLVTRILLFIVSGVVLGSVVAVKVFLTTLDPGDDAVRVKVRSRPQPAFDRALHAHVIDHDYYCNICQEIVHPSSKHCRQCNKCTLDFDHHCKWLNNCVGARNYKYFLIFVGVCVVASVCILAQSVVILICYFIQPDVVYQEEDGGIAKSLGKKAWLGLVVTSILISFFISILTIHLLCFHISLVKRGLTTYNFIMDQREGAGSAVTHPERARTGGGWVHKLKSSTRLRRSARAAAVGDMRAGKEREKSTVPELPPVGNTRGGTISSVSASVPFTQSNGTSKRVDSAKAKAERPIPLTEQVVKLPPIANGARPTTTTKLYEPVFESVLGEGREMTLPAILVTASDTDTLMGDSSTTLTSVTRTLPSGPSSTPSPSPPTAAAQNTRPVSVPPLVFHEANKWTSDKGAKLSRSPTRTPPSTPEPLLSRPLYRSKRDSPDTLSPSPRAPPTSASSQYTLVDVPL